MTNPTQRIEYVSRGQISVLNVRNKVSKKKVFVIKSIINATESVEKPRESTSDELEGYESKSGEKLHDLKLVKNCMNLNLMKKDSVKTTSINQSI